MISVVVYEFVIGKGYMGESLNHLITHWYHHPVIAMKNAPQGFTYQQNLHEVGDKSRRNKYSYLQKKNVYNNHNNNNNPTIQTRDSRDWR